jgi:hypothetical protein
MPFIGAEHVQARRWLLLLAALSIFAGLFPFVSGLNDRDMDRHFASDGLGNSSSTTAVIGHIAPASGLGWVRRLDNLSIHYSITLGPPLSPHKRPPIILWAAASIRAIAFQSDFLLMVRISLGLICPAKRTDTGVRNTKRS